MPATQTIESPGKMERDEQTSTTTTLRVSGMTCGNCARHVTEALQSVAGVQHASVTPQTEQAVVRWTPGVHAEVQDLIGAVKEAGFTAQPQLITRKAGAHRLNAWKLNLWLGGLVTVSLMIGEWVLRLDFQPWFRWLSFILAGIVQIVAGAAFYRGAWRQLKRGASNMDTLVSLGSTTAFAYSVWALFTQVGAHLYFLEAASIITLISIGHWLEARVSTRATTALRELLTLAPSRALRQNPGASEVEVPVSELRVGDIVILRPGDHVPVDGVVVEGRSAVNESMITGEALPKEKASSDMVFAGTINLDGRLVVRVSQTGEKTALAHIIAAVQRAQTSRAEIQRLGDRVSNVFVPIVVLAALAAALWWALAPQSALQVGHFLAHFLWTPHSTMELSAAPFVIAAAVLIVACPCAMGLATPAAIMAASNAAARKGILIRDGVALEKAGKVTAVLFDKTGTITQGKPQVVNVLELMKTAPQIRPTDFAAALARHSRHPVSQAIASISQSDFRVENWEELRGLGVRAKILSENGKAMAQLGSLRWLEECGIDLAAGEDFTKHWSSEGASVIGLAVDLHMAALFAVRDTIKPGTSQMMRELHHRGLKTFLVTGDTRLSAASIAKEAGIPAESVFAEVRPEAKAQIVRELQQKGGKVAFIGDGINDAPALEQADLGIAVSRASDIAREAADIVLLNSEIRAIPESLELARATLRVIKQNLFWAFFYNAAGIPLAALGFMGPVLCAGAMALSDMVVIGNALRLLRKR